MSEATAGPGTPPSGATPPAGDEGLRVVLVDDVIAVDGELDLDSSPRLLALLRATGTRRVDLAGVTFIDVAGLRSLVDVAGLEVVRTGPVVARLLRLCGLDDTVLGGTAGAGRMTDHSTGYGGRTPDESEPAMSDATTPATRVAFLTANEGVEQVELTEPWAAVEAAGFRPVLIAPKAGEVQAYHHLDAADRFRVDLTVGEADAADYAMLVLPGGVANPDELRVDADAVAFVRAVAAAGRPIAVICHGPWTLVEADLVRDRELTSWPSVRTDIVNAGGSWRDAEVVVCERGANVLISSRKPDDLPAFCAQIASFLPSPAEDSLSPGASILDPDRAPVEPNEPA